MMVGQFFNAVNAQLATVTAPPPASPSDSGSAASAPGVQSLTATPVQISPWRTLLQFGVNQVWEKLRQWFARSAS
jgi:hypothetical protein